MKDYRGQAALITGASAGIGEAFAWALAARGADVALVARGEDKLDALAAQISAKHGVRALAIAQDLVAPGAAQQIAAKLGAQGWQISALINNACIATYGRFSDVELASQADIIALNISALVSLTHLLLPQIIARSGGVINVASTAAFQPLPYMAIYAATKAFVLSFSEALAMEHRDQGVRVLALCPGPTDTPAFERAGRPELVMGVPSSDEEASLR